MMVLLGAVNHVAGIKLKRIVRRQTDRGYVFVCIHPISSHFFLEEIRSRFWSRFGPGFGHDYRYASISTGRHGFAVKCLFCKLKVSICAH